MIERSMPTALFKQSSDPKHSQGLTSEMCIADLITRSAFLSAADPLCPNKMDSKFLEDYTRYNVVHRDAKDGCLHPRALRQGVTDDILGFEGDSGEVSPSLKSKLIARSGPDGADER
jgi:hypothetical protein